MTDTATTNPVHDFIANAVTENPVVLFMSSVAVPPRCGSSGLVLQFLTNQRADFVLVDVLQDEAIGEGSKI